MLPDIETSRLIQYVLLALFPVALILFAYFMSRLPPHLRPPRPKASKAPEVPLPRAADLPRDNFGFIDDPSEYMDDAREDTSEPQKQSDNVGFSAIAPRRVRSGEAFRIFIHVERVPDTSSGPDADETFTAIVMHVQRGERLALVLENRNPTKVDRKFKLSVDAPYQSLTWRGGNLVLDFRVRAPVVQHETTIGSRLWLTAGNEAMGIPILKGKLDITTTVYPRYRTSLKDYEVFKRKPDAKAISHKEIETHFELARLGGVGAGAAEFMTAFICHAHADKDLVETYMAALEAASIRCEHDEFDFIAKPHWLKQAARLIAKVDVVYVFWSQTAALRPSIQSELRIIQAVIAQRERDNQDEQPSVKRPKPVVFVVVLDDVKVMVPDWFKEDLGYARRMQHFSSHEKAKSRPRLSESAELGEGP